MKAVIEITFGNQSHHSDDFDDYLAYKNWFSDEESECLVKNSIQAIKESIQLGYRYGKLKSSADDGISRPYFGEWELTIKSDEED